MSGWADQSKFKVEENHVDFPGDHFYVQDRKLVPKLVSKVAEYLTKVMGELISFFFPDQTNAKKRKSHKLFPFYYLPSANFLCVPSQRGYDTFSFIGS